MNTMPLIKMLLGLKFGWVIILVLGVFFIGSFIRNVSTGSFSVGKFLGGFNVFAGGVQGKLIYYGLIIFGCFVVYNFVMRPTYSYDTDYKNQIHHNEDVIVDQRVGGDGCNVEILFGLFKFGCKQKPVTKIVNNECSQCK